MGSKMFCHSVPTTGGEAHFPRECSNLILKLLHVFVRDSNI